MKKSWSRLAIVFVVILLVVVLLVIFLHPKKVLLSPDGSGSGNSCPVCNVWDNSSSSCVADSSQDGSACTIDNHSSGFCGSGSCVCSIQCYGTGAEAKVSVCCDDQAHSYCSNYNDGEPYCKLSNSNSASVDSNSNSNSASNSASPNPIQSIVSWFKKLFNIG